VPVTEVTTQAKKILNANSRRKNLILQNLGNNAVLVGVDREPENGSDVDCDFKLNANIGGENEGNPIQITGVQGAIYVKTLEETSNLSFYEAIGG